MNVRLLAIISIVVVAVVLLVMNSINRLPKHLINEGKSLEHSITHYSRQLDKFKKDYQELQQAADWSLLKPYAENEKWINHFGKAEEKINEAQNLYQSKIIPILDDNERNKAGELKKVIKSINETLLQSAGEYSFAAQRVKFLRESIANKEKYYKESKAIVGVQAVALEKLQKFADEMSSQYPKKATAIDELVKPIAKYHQDALVLAKRIGNEYNASITDFAVFADSHKSLLDNNDNFDRDLKKNEATIGQLSRSYVRILSDQKADYYITIGRANWCEDDFCGDGVTYKYPPVKVDENTFEYFNNLNLNSIARMTRSWGRENFKLNIPQNRWDALNISEKKNWNSSYPYAEYWIDKLEVRPYHKYTFIEDGRISNTDWRPVSLAEYEKNFEFLGMALATKPLGAFESESINTPEPVGMATIAEPNMVNGVATGKNQYGEWRQDSNGNSFWFYYGMYRLLGDFIPGGGYGYNTYKCYRSRPIGKPFYGCERHYGTFGRYTYTSDRYKNTTFSKQNPKVVTSAHTGKYTNVNHSVRGMGNSNRGRGPSRSGK